MDPKSKEKATGRARESATSTPKRSESTADTMMIDNDDNTDCFSVNNDDNTGCFTVSGMLLYQQETLDKDESNED